jgi:hypothetical protein
MSTRKGLELLWLMCSLALLPRPAVAQVPSTLQTPDAARESSQPQAAPPVTYTPIRGGQRIDWVAASTIGTSSLRIGIVASLWDTAINSPEEWGRTASGLAKRYFEREADVAISSAIEAGVGAFWGEEPRYIPSNRKGFWPRTRYAAKTVFLAQRRDGRLAPAWGRVAGNVVNNVIENTWLPPSATTRGETTLRTVDGFAGRLLGNLWSEFWPEIRKRLPG